ncbi:MAG: hypothetical protein J5501_05390 [Ruminococcus sp.]|nr:hypothetical protein [Ruminococcus sp.]
MDYVLFVQKANESIRNSIITMNEKTSKYGLSLSQEDVSAILAARKDTFVEESRIELGKSILPKLIETFCDSPYISQNDYRDSIIRLQDIFFHYKNETEDELSDDELLTIMREQFDESCFGSFDLLEGTILELFAEAVRRGYRGYIASQGKGEQIVSYWDRATFYEAFQELLEE